MKNFEQDPLPGDQLNSPLPGDQLEKALSMIQNMTSEQIARILGARTVTSGYQLSEAYKLILKSNPDLMKAFLNGAAHTPQEKEE